MCLNKTQINCVNDVWFEFSLEKCTECPLECETSIFPVSISSSDYLSDYYARFMYNHSNLLRSKLKQFDLSEIKKSIVSFTVYFSDLSFTNVTQVPKYELIDLITSVGGHLSLFIGISLLSFVEVIEAILMVCLKTKHQTES
jgi:hypothetical protein